MINEKEENAINPPWVEFPGSDPIWGGWRQGVSEAWLLETWLPFWKSLSAEKRRHYLEEWPPPTAEWDFYLNVAWLR
jgi:hypothetical protein